MSYLLMRGRRHVAHYAKYDAFGQIAGSWCGRPYNLASNVPWGRRGCKDCLRKMQEER